MHYIELEKESIENHWDAKIFLYVYTRVKYFYLLLIQYTRTLYYVKGMFFCEKKCSSPEQYFFLFFYIFSNLHVVITLSVAKKINVL